MVELLGTQATYKGVEYVCFDVFDWEGNGMVALEPLDEIDDTVEYVEAEDWTQLIGRY